MKKNLIFLTLLISVLMVSVVSASITGYLVRGRTLATDGYKATLQKVEGTTAIVSVATPSGTTKIVRVPEGENVQVGEAEISASSLTRGTLFRRGGGNIGLNISAGPVPDAINIGKGAVTFSGALCPNNQLLELGVLKVDSITNNCASKLGIGAPEIEIGSGSGGVKIETPGMININGFPLRLNSKQVELGTAGESVILKGYAYFNTLGGSGNAYACLDTNGKLYRSQTPCI